MKILIVTDTFDDINGVATTYNNLIKYSDCQIDVISPKHGLITIPGYSVIKITTRPWKEFPSIIEYDRVHIATEGPLGLYALIRCRLLGKVYTTAYHTRWDLFLNKIYGIPVWLTAYYTNWFHRKSKACFVPSKGMMIWDNCVLWTRGVDEKIFHKPNTPVTNTILYVGRVSKEKNIDLFCRLSEEMSYFKFVVVGDGPYRKSLQKRYKNVEFVGFKKGKDLAAYYQQARVMVFPSLTDTFGIVNIESMYCGTPVVAFNVTGPNDIIKQGVNGYLVETEKDMKQAVISACDLSRSEIADSVKKFSWKECYRIFKKHII